jgi:predicted RNA binding protein YcfA (HicA-like mRNA interferase family)
MKGRTLIQHLRQHGCMLLREGKRHTIFRNPANDRQTAVPRHREIDTGLARTICQQLDVPLPTER